MEYKIIIMNQKNSTELNWLDKLLKLFINKKRFLLNLMNDVDPLFYHVYHANKNNRK